MLRYHLAIWIAVACLTSPTLAAERLVDARAFDKLVLTSSKGGDTLKVRPLSLPDRKVPDPFPKGKLSVRLVSSGKQLDIPWSDIARIELFEQMLIKEARKLTGKKDFDEAFDYYALLHSRYPSTPGLKEASTDFLIKNARSAEKAGNLEQALAILTSLSELQPDASELGPAVDSVAGKLIEQRLRKRDFRTARSVLDVVSKKFSKAQLTVVDTWTQRFERGAEARVQEGAQFFRQQKFREARAAAIQAQSIWPTYDKAGRLLELIQQANPAVLVGVRTYSQRALTPRLDDPASLRTGYLTEPTLTRIADYSSEGGIYASPIGAVGLDPTGRELTLTVLDYPANSPAAFDAPAAVARRLLSCTSPNAENPSYALQSVVGSVLAPEPDLLVVGLARTHVRPEALLQEISLKECGLPAPLGSYSLEPVDATTVELHATSKGVGAAVVEEKRFDNNSEAFAALARGDIDVLSRVAPWQVRSLRENRNIVVGQYRLPTVHVLIPTRPNELLETREFRRALCYGIDRQRILDVEIQGGAKMDGFEVVSGPFPTGMSLNDPVRYGYNDGVLPRKYEPRLAAVLSVLSWSNLKKAEWRAERLAEFGDEKPTKEQLAELKQQEEKLEIPELPTLRIAHSADPVARAACASIKIYLQPLDIPVELVELDAEQLLDPDGDFDLRYAELAMWEPIVDAKRLLGLNGLAGRTSDPILIALDRLDEARNWKEAISTLRDIHTLAAGDLPVIPLWQTANFYAYRRNLSGLPQSTIHLYQTLSDWRKN